MPPVIFRCRCVAFGRSWSWCQDRVVLQDHWGDGRFGAFQWIGESTDPGPPESSHQRLGRGGLDSWVSFWSEHTLDWNSSRSPDPPWYVLVGGFEYVLLPIPDEYFPRRLKPPTRYWLCLGGPPKDRAVFPGCYVSPPKMSMWGFPKSWGYSPNHPSGNDFVPQTVCPHWVLTVAVKAGAWSGCPLRAPAFLPVNFRIKWLLWNLDMCFDWAGSHKVWAAVLGNGIFPVNFRIKWLLWHVEVHFECAGSHKVWS